MPPNPPIIVLDGLAGHQPAGHLGAVQSAISAGYSVVLALWIAAAAIVGLSMIARVVVLPWWRARQAAAGHPSRPPTAWGRAVRWLPYALLLLPPLATAYVALLNHDGAVADKPRAGRYRLERPDRQRVVDVVAAAADGTREPPKDIWLPTVAGSPTYVALRRNGRLLGEGWTVEDGTLVPLATEVKRLADHAARGESADAVEIAFAHSFRDVSKKRRADPISNVDRGLLGIELTYGDAVRRISPTEMIARNLSIKQTVADFVAANKIDAGGLGRMRVRTFGAEVLLVQLGHEPRGDRMVRGNEVVDIEDVTRSRVERLADLEIDWMLANLLGDGRMTYFYAPSRGTELSGNNMIRQWMATIALERIAVRRDDRALWDRAAANIDYNLAQFYSETAAGLGVIRYDGTVKLGALSLAALALVEHPDRARWQRQEQALRRTVDSMWRDDGSFQTFFEPADRDGQNNFYPGETLLLWASLLEREHDPVLLDRFMRSFRYFKRWHLSAKNRNPAFIPWHTRAYVKVWRKTGDADLAKFVFQMNDWLLGVQQWSDKPDHPDVQGRFFDPDRPFGPPHSSSDGVYLEGLIDAHSLAVALGDRARAESYRLAIVRGLRNLLQLQFVDDVDMFYVRNRQRVRGGIRTTVYDNRIRCDNVQHTLMAVLDILDRWEDQMFAVDPRAMFASVEVTVHPALAARFAAGGSLLLRLRRLDDGQTVWSHKEKAVQLPRRVAIPTRELGAAAVAPLFLDVSYRPPPRSEGARTLRGEAWGTFGKPSAIRPGQEIVLALSQLASPPAPPIKPAAAPAFPSVEDAVNPILIQGVIKPHPDLELPPGGVLHLRVLSLELGRPFAFHRFENVTFPLEFSIRARDQFYPRALERVATHRFYIDATYNPPGQSAEYGLFLWEPPAVAGNGWGRGGPPMSLKMGESTEIWLDRYWTKEQLRGRLERWPGARAEGWIFLTDAMRAKATADNRLVFALRSPSPTGDKLLAIKVYEDIDPARPIAYHMDDDDFVGGTAPDERAYFSAWLECYVGGKRARILIGGRASPETPISAFPHTLRIALIEESPDGPELAIPDLAKIPVSPATYR